jgi:hypothetical protein
MPENTETQINTLFLAHADEVSAAGGRMKSWPQALSRGLSCAPKPEVIKELHQFLFSTTCNVASAHFRRRKTRGRHYDYSVEPETIGGTSFLSDHHCEDSEMLALLSDWLVELPELHRHAFVLARIEGIPHKEIRLMALSIKIALFAAAIFSIGCAPVQPWERGKLAKPQMALDVYPWQSSLHGRNYASRVAASGSNAAQGGGCG